MDTGPADGSLSFFFLQAAKNIERYRYNRWEQSPRIAGANSFRKNQFTADCGSSSPFAAASAHVPRTRGAAADNMCRTSAATGLNRAPAAPSVFRRLSPDRLPVCDSTDAFPFKSVAGVLPHRSMA
jgi:hypothetical protein